MILFRMRQNPAAGGTTHVKHSLPSRDATLTYKFWKWAGPCNILKAMCLDQHDSVQTFVQFHDNVWSRFVTKFHHLHI